MFYVITIRDEETRRFEPVQKFSLQVPQEVERNTDLAESLGHELAEMGFTTRMEMWPSESGWPTDQIVYRNIK
tara:strand:+ start:1499 stop:1717 length:219 start_codon:yes stop_codon:yes gene_type:complete